jgi:sulfate adenylyltransferase subunit 1
MNARLEVQISDGSALADRGVLRFITAGSVDDGKSTLIGRLLYDTRSILSDQLDALARAGQRRSAVTPVSDAAVDLSLLTDGLEAEREQGITIDVAYRYFATARRKFIIADTPGHEQYTRNMVTGASTADAAVILIDATRVTIGPDGRALLLPQTRRHAALVHLLGLRHVVVAINKMDQLDFDPARFEAIVAAFADLAERFGIDDYTAIPISALHGDNIVRRSSHTPWFRGPVLLEWLEAADLDAPRPGASAGGGSFDPLRFAVQLVQKGAPRIGAGARAYLGRVGAGELAVGQRLRVLPSNATATVVAIETFDGDVRVAIAGQSVSVRLDREVDLSRGDWLVDANPATQPQLARQIRADLAWLDSEPLAPQRRLWLRHGTRFVLARVRSVDALLDLESVAWRSPTCDDGSAATLGPNDIGRVVIEVQHPLPFDSFDRLRATGAVVLIDATTHHTVAAGMLREAA